MKLTFLRLTWKLRYVLRAHNLHDNCWLGFTVDWLSVFFITKLSNHWQQDVFTFDQTSLLSEKIVKTSLYFGPLLANILHQIKRHTNEIKDILSLFGNLLLTSQYVTCHCEINNVVNRWIIGNFSCRQKLLAIVHIGCLRCSVRRLVREVKLTIRLVMMLTPTMRAFVIVT